MRTRNKGNTPWFYPGIVGGVGLRTAQECEGIVCALQETRLIIGFDDAVVILFRERWVRAGVVHAYALDDMSDVGLLVLANTGGPV